MPFEALNKIYLTFIKHIFSVYLCMHVSNVVTKQQDKL